MLMKIKTISNVAPIVGRGSIPRSLQDLFILLITAVGFGIGGVGEGDFGVGGEVLAARGDLVGSSG